MASTGLEEVVLSSVLQLSTIINYFSSIRPFFQLEAKAL